MLPNVLPVEDTEISVALEKSFAKQGIKIFTSTKLFKAEGRAPECAAPKSRVLKSFSYCVSSFFS